ncbi:glycoprotein-N-acetylgalactosamine 3-beta-galactosyltransferase 1 [Eurytemora carolleeae]|uniref:glycoprotein-N-acetylgalactosamine 3-beta-galactosyltransferase 1 n=1 Tax=Eurytemora carolleeae TaxID=1294199 RepID=UPI000C761406|nr:glycoprotein-N-acetylgalactosamine 3-beta-galactosyltransferase 1 [Eurytemora carolleeae]|eukprot:XP_023341085.1 glycoprotein-N-acetylgalactosamine 3-beta-galactosyltransferase 1-like [Eurytemora affinis]
MMVPVRRLRRRFISFLMYITRDQKTLFGISFLLGMLLAVIFQSFHSTDDFNIAKYSYDFAYEKWLYSRGLYSVNTDPDKNRYKDKNEIDVEAAVNPMTEAGFLYSQVPVVCIVFPDQLSAALTVKNTWGQHCNYLRFYSAKVENSSIPVRKIPSKSSFGLLCSALLDLEKEELNYSWVLFFTEDTFVLPENFRYFAAALNSTGEHYLGHAIRFWNVVYNWGDAGYALSRGAVSALLNRFSTQELCEAGGKYWKNGDWYLGKHLHDLGIFPVDTRDEQGKGRFNGFSFKKLLFPGGVSLFERYWKDSLYLSPDGPQCCSNHAISFHGILSSSKIYQLEYMFYHLRPFYSGGIYGNSPAPPPIKAPYLSWEEKMKEEELQKMFNSLLTTPEGMHEVLASSMHDALS